MSTKELQLELHSIIDNSNKESVVGFYNLIKDYLQNSENSKMIAESEIDIKTGKIHSQTEVQNIIESWTV